VDTPYLFWVKELLVAVGILLLFWLLSRLLRRFLVPWGTRLTAFTATDLDDRVLTRVAPPLALLTLFAGLYFAVTSLPLADKLLLVVSGAVFVVNVAIVGNIAYRTVDELLKWYAGRLAEQDRGGLDRQLLPLLEKLTTIFLASTALIIILKHFNYDILSLVTALGIGSLAIGLAAKDTLANMISGFTLMLDRPFRIGDRIQLAAGQWGDVLDIGLRSTKVRTLEHTVQIIPNSTLCSSVVTNMAFPDQRAKGRVNVGVAYGTDIGQAKEILLETARTVPEVLREPGPEAFFTGFGTSSLDLALFFWVEEYARLFPVTDLINEAILARFAAAGLTIPFPTQTVHLQKD
jgi:small-conductance mechanosensitive channel